MQPMMAMVQTRLNEVHERWSKLVDAVPESALNWQPGDETTNSIAQFVRHVVFGRRFMLGVALGKPPTFSGPPDARAHGLHNDPDTHAELTARMYQRYGAA